MREPSQIILMGIVAIGMGTLFGVYGLRGSSSNKLPSKDEIRRISPLASLHDCSFSSSARPIELKVVDSNNDGQVDALCWRDVAYWKTSDWKGEVCHKARDISPELRRRLNSYLESAGDLRDRLFDEAYRIQGLKKD